MTTMSRFSRRAASGGAALALLGFVGFTPAPTFAHETNCPYCKLKVVQDTPTQDNEVALRYGRKRIEYRSVWCAIADVNKGTYKSSDINILAPSDKKAQPVEITRVGGKWSAPKESVFLGVTGTHPICNQTQRAFTSKAAYEAYVAKNKAILTNAAPLTLDQLVASAK